MKTVLALAALALTLGGCASSATKQAQVNYYSAQAEALKAHSAQQATNLLEIDIDDSGKLKRLVVGRQIGNAPQIAMPTDPNVQMVGKLVDGAVAVGSIVAGGKAAQGLVSAVGGVVGTALKEMPQPVVVTQPEPVQIPGAPAPVVVQVPAPEIVQLPAPEVIVLPQQQ